jgi:hypothetical protein
MELSVNSGSQTVEACGTRKIIATEFTSLNGGRSLSVRNWGLQLVASLARASACSLTDLLFSRYCGRDAATSPLRTEKAHRLDATQYAISR